MSDAYKPWTAAILPPPNPVDGAEQLATLAWHHYREGERAIKRVEVKCGCHRRASWALCGFCLKALENASDLNERNELARETHALAQENAKLRGIVKSLAARVAAQAELLAKRAEKGEARE